MRRIPAIIACLLVAAPIQSLVVLEPFHGTYWSADAIVVGRVAETAEMTVDIDVESRLRDRTYGTASRIRVFRYARPSCVPTSPEPYDVGSRYILLMRKPHDEGAGGNEHWMIIFQHQLRGEEVCLDNLRSPVEATPQECATTVSEPLFLEALTSFEKCFLVGDEDKIRGSYPTKQVCSDGALEDWSKRSPMHQLLAKTATEWLRKEAAK